MRELPNKILKGGTGSGRKKKTLSNQERIKNREISWVEAKKRMEDEEKTQKEKDERRGDRENRAKLSPYQQNLKDRKEKWLKAKKEMKKQGKEDEKEIKRIIRENNI